MSALCPLKSVVTPSSGLHLTQQYFNSSQVTPPHPLLYLVNPLRFRHTLELCCLPEISVCLSQIIREEWPLGAFNHVSFFLSSLNSPPPLPQTLWSTVFPCSWFRGCNEDGNGSEIFLLVLFSVCSVPYGYYCYCYLHTFCLSLENRKDLSIFIWEARSR